MSEPRQDGIVHPVISGNLCHFQTIKCAPMHTLGLKRPLVTQGQSEKLDQHPGQLL